MLDYILPILGQFFGSDFYLQYLLLLIPLAFLATVPIIIRWFIGV